VPRKALPHSIACAATLCRELEQTGTLPLQLQQACKVGLADEAFGLVERTSFAHPFEPDGRLHRRDFALHVLFTRGGDALRRDVRLCARLGLCDYWVRTDRWPDCADEFALHYDFREEARQQPAESA
jgi:hypothetical protein